MAYCHFWDGKYVIHSEADCEMDLNFLKKAKKISNLIGKEFKNKGVKTIYTWAETEEQKKYNLFLGYTPTGKTVNETFTSKDYPREVYEYKKDLN